MWKQFSFIMSTNLGRELLALEIILTKHFEETGKGIPRGAFHEPVGSLSLSLLANVSY